MTDLSTIASDLKDKLKLAYAPVGIQFYGTDADIPPDLTETQTAFKSYCHALVAAGEGEDLLLRRDRMGCKLGTSVLGFESDTEAFLDDGVLEKYGVGLFATEEASSATILKSTYLAKGSNTAARIAPLAAFPETPEVVVFTANSEQVMWLLYAINYKKGGQMALPQSGGALGGCADITTVPMIQGIANVTFLGLGCRLKSGIDGCHLMLGLPGTIISEVHDHILAMAKPIGMLASK